MSATEPKQYFDSEGRECTLDVLCMREPAWAANRIRAEEARAKTAEDALADSEAHGFDIVAAETRMTEQMRTERDTAIERAEAAERERDEARDALARLREVAAAVERRIVYSDTSRCWYLAADPGQPALSALREALAEAPYI